MLRYPEEFYSINDVALVPTDFGGRENRNIFSAISAVADEKQTPDIASVIEALRAQGKGASEEYLSRLREIPCSLAQAKDAAQTVKGLSVSRALVDLGVKTIESAKENRSDFTTALDEVESEFALTRRGIPRSTATPTSIADIISDLKNSDVTAGIP